MSIHVSGPLFILLGSTALALTAFSVENIRAALRHAIRPPGREAARMSAFFWEATARNSWIAGVLGSVVYFVLAFSDSESQPARLITRMAQAFVPAIYGLAAGGIALVTAWKLYDGVEDRRAGPAAGEERHPRNDSAGNPGLGLLLFLALLVGTLLIPYGGANPARTLPWRLMIHWPAVLVVLGAALTVLLLAGGRLGPRVRTAAFAGAGTGGSLIGVVSVLLGIAALDISRIMSGLSFMLTALTVALLAIALVANPAEDRAVRSGVIQGYSWVSRSASLLFPLIALLLVLVAFIVVITPLQPDGAKGVTISSAASRSARSPSPPLSSAMRARAAWTR